MKEHASHPLRITEVLDSAAGLGIYAQDEKPRLRGFAAGAATRWKVPSMSKLRVSAWAIAAALAILHFSIVLTRKNDLLLSQREMFLEIMSARLSAKK